MVEDWQLLPFCSFLEKDTLPKTSGVYLLVLDHTNVLYIGQSKSIHGRWCNHHIIDLLKDEDKRYAIYYSLIDSSSLLHSTEVEYINTLRPLHNRAAKHGKQNKIKKAKYNYGDFPTDELLLECDVRVSDHYEYTHYVTDDNDIMIADGGKIPKQNAI